jgi:hypothetical protein
MAVFGFDQQELVLRLISKAFAELLRPRIQKSCKTFLPRFSYKSPFHSSRLGPTTIHIHKHHKNQSTAQSKDRKYERERLIRLKARQKNTASTHKKAPSKKKKSKNQRIVVKLQQNPHQ